MKVHQVVKIKAGRLRGMVGVVKSVDGDAVSVQVDGVMNGKTISELLVVDVKRLEVRR